MADPILVARHGDIECSLLPALANRHGLITGATGTGKTISLQTLAENFSQQGVPVFMADVKGDLTGISQRGVIPPKMAAVLAERGIELPEASACPCTLWDVFADDKKAQGRCCSRACWRSTRRSRACSRSSSRSPTTTACCCST